MALGGRPGPGGTAYLHGTRWQAIDDAPGQALTITPDGTVWVLGDDGPSLTAWREGTSDWTAVRHPAPGQPLFATSMDILPDGSLVAQGGDWVPVLTRFDGSTWRTLLEDEIAGRPLEWVGDTAADAAGHLWVLWSTPTRDEDELSVYSTARLDEGTWTIFDVPAVWPHRLVAGPGGPHGMTTTASTD